MRRATRPAWSGTTRRTLDRARPRRPPRRLQPRRLPPLRRHGRPQPRHGRHPRLRRPAAATSWASATASRSSPKPACSPAPSCKQRRPPLPQPGLPPPRRAARERLLYRPLQDRTRCSAPPWPTATATTLPTPTRSTAWRVRASSPSATAPPTAPSLWSRRPTPTARNATSPASSRRTCRVMGLMPHPEDLVDPLMGGMDGLPLFQGMAEALAA